MTYKQKIDSVDKRFDSIDAQLKKINSQLSEHINDLERIYKGFDMLNQRLDEISALIQKK